MTRFHLSKKKDYLEKGILFLFIYLALYTIQGKAQADDLEGIEIDSIPDLELVRRGETLKAYHLHPALFTPKQVAPDTTFTHYYRKCCVEGWGLAIGNNGNFVGPRYYKTFFDRRREWDLFPYGQAFEGLFYRTESLLYYNTQSPYTKLTYHRFGPAEQREEILDMTLALNVNKRINLGGDFNYFLSRGFYTNNKGRQVGYRLFGSYVSPRYELYFSGGNNYLNLNENGGIIEDDYINHPEKFSGSRRQLKSIEIPVKYTQGVKNLLFIGHVHLSHRINLGKRERFMLGDRLPNGEKAEVDTTLFIPIASIGHKLEYRKGARFFMGANKRLENEYGGHTYPYYWQKKIIKQPDGKEIIQGDTLQIHPYDSVRVAQLSNTLTFDMQEGFRPWVKFGITAYARFENRFYFMRDSIEGNGRSNDFSTYIGGNIHRQSGKQLNFDVTGEFALLGRDLGSIRVFGEVSSLVPIKRFPLLLKAYGGFYNIKPPKLLEHHRGTYIRWDLSLPFYQSLYLGGVLSIPRYGTTFSVNSATLNNYIYFEGDRLPQVAKKPIQILEAKLHHQYNWKILFWELAASYQLSSDKEILPLPMISAFASIYLKFMTAKVMHTEIGADCYYHTSYYAPSYDVATQQFINQKEVRVGSFPLLNLFASFKLRRVRFFLCYYNLADHFLNPSRRWSLPHMPINPPSLRIGISFDFNN